MAGDKGFYGYSPTLWISALYVALFGISTATHLFQGIRYNRKKFLFTAFLCGVAETSGWGARVWSHYAPTNLTPYLIQTVLTIDGPTFLIASLFITLAEIITRLGPCYSRIRPRLYAIIFLSADLFSLGIQGVGGGLAATAAGTPGKSPTLGGNIMLAGIVLQLIGMTIYVILAIEFGVRFFQDRPFDRPHSEMIRGTHAFDKSMKQMIGAMLFATFALYVRSIYRVIELSGGWTGPIITTEIYIVIFDALMVLCALISLNVFFPGRLFADDGSSVAMNVTYEGVKLAENHSDVDLTERFDGSTLHSRNVSATTFSGEPKLEGPRYNDPYYAA